MTVASRAVCPRCRRSYQAAALVCAVDGETLIEEDELLLAGRTEPVVTPPSLVSATRRAGAWDDVEEVEELEELAPELPPTPPLSQAYTGSGRFAAPRPRANSAPPIAPARATPPPGTPRSDISDPLFRTTGLNAPARRRTDPPAPRHRTTDPPVHGPLTPPSGFRRDTGPMARVDPSGAGLGWLGERLGPYRLLRQLGEGGMARIYLAEHEKLGRICAIKRLHADHFADRLTVARFLAEARAVGAIHHPNLVAAYDVVEEPNEIYLVMEYLDGRDVAHVLRTEGPMAPARAVDIIAQACDGLAAVHAHNIVHRDLKPENIFLTRDPDGHERVKLLDFGVARLIGDRPQELKTRSGLTVGTPTYMSPEQATASEIDARSDIYTVGVVLYEMLCGMPPFTGAGYGDVMLMHVNDAAPRLSSRRSDVPPWLESVVTRCLEKEPDQRFESAAELAAVLRAGPRSSAPTHQDPRGTMRVRTIPQVKQGWNWRPAAAVLGAVLLFCATVLTVLWTQRGAEPPARAPAVATLAPSTAANTVPGAVPNTAPAPPPPAPPVAATAAPVPQEAPAAAPVMLGPPHRVRVTTRPYHATVSLRGQEPCRSPCYLLIPNMLGTVEIHVSAPGYVDDSRTVDASDPPNPLRLRLSRIPKTPSSSPTDDGPEATSETTPEPSEKKRGESRAPGGARDGTVDPFDSP